LIAHVSAGAPIEIGDEIEQIDLNWMLTRGNPYAMLICVRGESMSEEIRDGDKVIIDRSRDPQPNDIVLAKLSDGYTLKRYKFNNGHRNGLPTIFINRVTSPRMTALRYWAWFKNFIDTTFGPVADGFDKTRYDKTVIIVKAAYAYFKDKPMRSIKAADIERLKAARISLPTMHGTARKPATVEREMSIISSIFAMAVKNDVIDYNPCSRVVQKLSFDNVQDKILRREDEDAFFAHMHSEWARDVCRMALYTGLRQNDIMNLTRFQVDLPNNSITLIQGKTKRRVIVMLNAVSYEILERRMSRKSDQLFLAPPMSRPRRSKRTEGSVRHAMQRACARAQISVITIRDLRRTNLTRKIEAHNDLATVARSAGHTDTRMMSRYVRSLELLQKAADSIVHPATNPPHSKFEKVKLLKRKG